MKSICIDFDGVIHSYTSKWTNPQTISDGPVEGAFEFIENCIKNNFQVWIFSSRLEYMDAQSHMFDWFIKHGLNKEILHSLGFTYEKVPAILYIDDRGYHFQGTFPSIEFIKNFKPWNKI